MKKENNQSDQNATGPNLLRKYTLSPVTLPFLAAFTYFTWRYLYTSFAVIPFLLVAALSIFAGIYPVRVTARNIGNEYFANDFVIVLGIAFLDPFQLALAFSIGTTLAHTYNRMPLKRIYLNQYSNMYVGVLTGLIVHAPVSLKHWHFALVLLVGVAAYYVLDAVSYYFVCKFPIKELIVCIISPERVASMAFGLVLGIPTVLLMNTRPEFSFIMILIYCAICLSFNKYSNLSNQKDQYQQIVEFMTDTTDDGKIGKSEQRIIDISKNAFRHQGVQIQPDPPNDISQIGEKIHSDDQGDRWLVINRNDVSSARNEHDLKLLNNIATAARSAFEHRDLYEKMFVAARHDALTGLCNRGTLEEFVEHELGLVKRGQTEFCLMFIDLDKFKPINDTYGHKAGDEVLKCIARRLTLTVRTQDVVARIGGDEFVILCRDITIKDAKLLAGRISEEIKKPIYVDDQNNNEERIELDVGSSIGISSAPKDAITFETLLKTADQNMYKNKTKTKTSSNKTQKSA